MRRDPPHDELRGVGVYEAETRELDPVLPMRAGPPAEDESHRRGTWWRGLTGTLAAGLAVLALVVLGAQLFWIAEDAPGPGAADVVGHLVAAALAVVAQVLADRKRGVPAGVAGLGVVVFVVGTLWIFWWG